jgi:uncharacterized protein
VDEKERVVRDLYEARARRDWRRVGELLADDVAWHEPGGEDYSGDHHGREQVVSLLQRLLAATGGTFRLAPEAFMHAAEHSAVLVRWSAERNGTRCDGNEIAVYRLRDGRIGEAWFYPDGYDAEALSAVFSSG